MLTQSAVGERVQLEEWKHLVKHSIWPMFTHLKGNVKNSFQIQCWEL